MTQNGETASTFATLANWRTTHGSDKTVLTSDRLPNLIRYALGLAANVPAAPMQMPAASMLPVTGQSYLTLAVPRRLRRSDASYAVRVSSDFKTWNSGPGHTVIVEDTDTRLVVRDAVASSGNAKRFIRLAVRAQP